jgi:hypothetical protein
MQDGIAKEREMNIDISPRKVLIIMLSLIGLLLLANILGLVSTYVFHHPYLYGIVDLFDFDGEKNLPTLYSTLQLIVAGVLLAVIGSCHKSSGENYARWYVLALIFLFLGFDEFAQIHERFVVSVRDMFQLTGVFYFAWVVPYGIGALVVVIAFSGFLLRLPRKTARWFIVSGAIYVSGAIGFEMLGARHYEAYGLKDLAYSILYTFEESLEMLGITLFIYALLAYVADEFQYLKANIRD